MQTLKHISRRRINRCEAPASGPFRLRQCAPSVQTWNARAMREAEHVKGLYRAAANVAALSSAASGLPATPESLIEVARAPVGLCSWVRETLGRANRVPPAVRAYLLAAHDYLTAYHWGPERWISAPPPSKLSVELEAELDRLGAEIDREIEIAVTEYADDLKKWKEDKAAKWGTEDVK